MNERIQELAEQAGYLRDGFGFGHWDMAECQKFAELLIRECAKVADEGLSEVTMKGPKWPSHYIKKHFGIE
jgi:hypothetical protein